MTYEAILSCNNCGQLNTVVVNDNVIVKDHIRLKTEVCKNCKMRINSYTIQHKGL